MKNLGLVVIAAFLGAVGVQCLIYLINALSSLCYLGAFSIEAPDLSNSGLGAWMVVIPVAGALLGILLIKSGKKSLTPLSAVIMTGAGFPFGIEGVLASGLFLCGERKLLKAAVIASGLACLLNAPVAGAVLVFELGFVEVSVLNVLALVLAAGTGCLLRFVWRGWDAVLFLETLPAFRLGNLYIYFLAGMVVSLLGILMNWLIKKLGQITFQRAWLPVAAAFVIGVLGWLRPEGLGTGSNFIPELASGHINLQILLGLSLVRMVMLILAAGAGAPGRELIISPFLLIGGALGMASIFLICLAAGQTDVTPGLAAIVGIVALLAGRLPVILTALILSIELTHQWMVLLPVITALIPAILLRKWIVRSGTN
ncbi:chloride channel protein [Chitinophaga sancti]|uniref:Chloride channel protein n=1 Tax=Chitinophaga sancti TaxID=1004 RepID=A0A1K1NVX8_9BACT|nr:chloride channel protein [Chitinophaga sancti]WQD60249.1 chloride channel protein [Chitinophaga sancti]WQG87623.1 chloride channel protein [Chitinophaga sancti]SFW39682.1 Voltage gated chloride channel [Chitinophaga sancti]